MMPRRAFTIAAIGFSLSLPALLVGRAVDRRQTELRDVFREGYYSLPYRAYSGEHFEFRNGRFKCIQFSDVGPEIPPLPGRYDVLGTRVTLTFDNPKHGVFAFQWRNVGGVPLILNRQAAAIFDNEKRLVSEPPDCLEAEYYILKENPSRETTLWLRHSMAPQK